jgi:hypothetical protein
MLANLRFNREKDHSITRKWVVGMFGSGLRLRKRFARSNSQHIYDHNHDSDAGTRSDQSGRRYAGNANDSGHRYTRRNADDCYARDANANGRVANPRQPDPYRVRTDVGDRADDDFTH